MTPWQCLIIIFLAGGFGGLANAFMSGEGLALPHRDKEIWCPGFVGNSFVGALAALVSWGLYGSGSGVELAKEVAAGREYLTYAMSINTQGAENASGSGGRVK
jgi:hypothetical protein